ncbi:MAG: GNAT family N-acetyltransferase [Litoreibacter sp.]
MTTNLFDVIDTTWPAVRVIEQGVWHLREGAGGGKRVSAVTLHGQLPRDLPEAALFSVREDQNDLDQMLADRGYRVVDPSVIFSCPIETVAKNQIPRITAFDVWPPFEIMCAIWDAGGIGSERRDVMARATCEKTSILGRINGRAAGTCYAGLHQAVTMVHALEILAQHRRFGLARHMMALAAKWGQKRGSDTFSVVTTESNEPAKALYSALGMSIVGRYHYRMKPDEGRA